MKTVFYTIVNDRYFIPVGTHKLINSFKKYHPDIDLVVFRQDMIDKMMVNGINFYNSKPVFAKLLTDKYDLVVNIDADTVVLGRLDQIIKGDYDVGSVWNFNDYENRAIENIREDQYVQAGLVASTNRRFWDIWQEANKDAMKYRGRENDILNIIWYNNEEVMRMHKVLFDRERDYYGCKSLNRESEFYVEEDRVMCRGEQVYLYHNAKGGHLPKLVYESMGFSQPVVGHLNRTSEYGRTVTYV